MEINSTSVTVNVAELRKGDRFATWVATSDAQVISQPDGGQDILVDVQFIPDGGFGHRAWPKAQEQTLTVQRP